ncbi:MAG TPA: glycosyltransferase [Pirellulales bacterium]|jgi:glycosyltransferase involved in cell wall biosynthesis|nr:glycosyltransferase [Pirellulales bacterium]
MPPIHSNRLAFFISQLGCGGAERVTVNLIRAAADAGIPIDLLLARAEGPLLSEVPSQVRIINFRAARLQRAIPKIALYLRRERPWGIISQITHANLVCLIARALAGTKTPLVAVEHNHFSAMRAAGGVRPRVERLARWLYPWADHIVAVSSGAARDVEQCLGLPAHRVRTVYNPIVDARLLARAEEPCPHPWLADGTSRTTDEQPVLLTVGRLAPQKDHATLLHALAIVRRTRAARLVIFGEGAERARLESLRRQLGLEAAVDLPGLTDNPYAAMRAASLFVLSSRFEGLPTVLVEALACGCPAVSTTCPSGPAEILADGRYGTLVPPENPEALAAGILQGLDWHWDRDKLRRRGAEFSMDASLHEYLDILDYPRAPSVAPAALGLATLRQRQTTAA